MNPQISKTTTQLHTTLMSWLPESDPEQADRRDPNEIQDSEDMLEEVDFQLEKVSFRIIIRCVAWGGQLPST